MVLANYGDKETVHGHHHSIHLHGHDFVVIKTGFPIADPKTGELIEKNKDLYCADKLCRDMHWRNYTNTASTFDASIGGPIQDTVLVPFGGYTVVRIQTDNPGKIIHPKYHKHLKKGAHQSHLGRQKMGWFLAD